MAKAYARITTANAWFAERQLNHWHEHDLNIRLAALLRASEWIDRSFAFIGQPESSMQERAWPRMNAILADGTAITDVPDAVIEATYILAEALLEDNQAGEVALGLGPRVLGERAAGIEIRYDRSVAGETRIQRLLKPLLARQSPQQPIRRG